MNQDGNVAARRHSGGWPVFVVLAAIFLGWAMVFIGKTSVQGLDGQRYFSLFDDAMIAMRYAWNLAHGYGPVWNPGERVEGYTSPLMVLVMAALSALMRDKSLAVLGVQVLGIVTLLGIGFLARSVFRRLPSGPANQAGILPEAVQIAGTLWYYPLAYMTLMGMETGLVTVLLLAAVVLAFRTIDDGRTSDLVGMGLVLGLAYLARPDALIFAALIYAWLARKAFSRDGARLRSAWFASLALLMIVTFSHIGFRWYYYGQLVPNTYTLKVQGFPLVARIENGLAHVRPFVWDVLPLGLLAGLALLFNTTRKAVLLVRLFASSVAYTVWIGGDAWRLWRLIAPTMPLLLALAVHEATAVATAVSISLRGPEWRAYTSRNPAIFRAIAPAWKTWRRYLPWLDVPVVAGVVLILGAVAADSIGLSGPGFGEEQVILLLAGLGLLAIRGIGRWIAGDPLPSSAATTGIAAAAMVAIGLLFANRPFLREMTFRKLPSDAEFNAWRIHVAQALSDVTSEQATIGVAGAGVIPYYTGRRAIDFLGKSDPYIAGLPADLSGAMTVGTVRAWPGHNKYDLDYSIGFLRPTYVQLLRWGADDLCSMLGNEYVAIDYRGVRLYFLSESPDVDWDRLYREGETPPAEEACSKPDS